MIENSRLLYSSQSIFEKYFHCDDHNHLDNVKADY